MQENLSLYFHPKMSIFICLLWRYEKDSDETALSHWTGSFCCRCAAEAALGTFLSLSLAVKLSCPPRRSLPNPPRRARAAPRAGARGLTAPCWSARSTAPRCARRRCGARNGEKRRKKPNLFLSLQSVIIRK